MDRVRYDKELAIRPNGAVHGFKRVRRMWGVATQVSTGIALAAFLAVAGLSAFRASLKSRAKVIQSLPAEARGDALAKELNAFGIDGRGLSKQQQFQLALKEIELRRARLSSATMIVIIVAVIAGLLAGISTFVGAPAASTSLREEHDSLVSVVEVGDYGGFMAAARSLGFTVQLVTAAGADGPIEDVSHYTVVTIGSRVSPDFAIRAIRLARRYYPAIRYVVFEFRPDFQDRVLVNAHQDWVAARGLKPLTDADFERLLDPKIPPAEFKAVVQTFAANGGLKVVQNS